MNCVIFVIALIALLGLCNGDRYYNTAQPPQTYENRTVFLSSMDMTWTINLTEDEYKYIITVNSSTSNSYSLSVWIDSMNCETSFTSPNPSYIIVESEELGEYRVCAATITPLPSKFNDRIQHVGLREVIITPKGDWSPTTTNVKIRVELVQIPKVIVMGDAIPQLDLVLDGSADYEIRLDKKSKLCNMGDTWDCSLSLSLIQMKCSGVSPLGLTWTNMTGANESDDWCVEYQYSTTSNPDDIKSIQSSSSILLASSSPDFTNNPVKVSISVQFSSLNESSCPNDSYFNCAGHCEDPHYVGSHCIPTEWTCDKTPHCLAICPNADERKYFCNKSTTCWSDDYFSYGVFSLWNLFFFLICLIGVVTLFCVFRSLYFHRMTRQTRNFPNDNRQGQRIEAQLPPPSYSKATGMPIPNRV